MCYKVEQFISDSGQSPITEFISKLDINTQDWVISAIKELETRKGLINNQNLETKRIRNQVFELKFKKLPVRILYSYHPRKRKFLLLLHGVIKKRDDLKPRDIKTAEERYKIEKNRQESPNRRRP